MRRVVVTGMGLVSCLGNDLDTVEAALRSGQSGIRYLPDYAERGLRSCVAGVPCLDDEPPVDRRFRRFMGDTALYAYCAMRHAVEHARLAPEVVSSRRTGLVVGSGAGSAHEHVAAVERMQHGGLAKVLPYIVPRFMGSTTSACLSTFFGIQGTSYSLTAACSTGAHCIGHGADLIRLGKQDVMIVGGAEEVGWEISFLFDAMGALSTNFNDTTASRPFDKDRDGFVIAGGAGVLVLEELEHARQRGARIYGEITGYGASCDGVDMVTPSSEGAVRAMTLALEESGREIGYINAHATSTRLGDVSEMRAVQSVFGASCPVISSTKGLSGHSIGAAGAHEAIFSLLMLDRGFLAGCANVATIDPECADAPILLDTVDTQVDSILSNSFGFGGTNASLVFSRLTE